MNKTKLKCLGLIMDGNRRWARDNDVETLEGHQKGVEVMQESFRWIRDMGVANAIYYAFSTENWNRSKQEVGYLMNLFSTAIDKLDAQVEADNKENPEAKIQLKIVGCRSDFSEELQNKMNKLDKKFENMEGVVTTVWIALSYGGRAEIVEAVNKAILVGEKVTEESFAELLWTADMPDPDMIVRTSGEQRLSNFVTWKSVYSELFFMDKHWPALTKSDFEDILREYETRERRKGV